MKRFWASVLAISLVFAMLATGAWAEFDEVSDAFEPEVEEVEEIEIGGETEEFSLDATDDGDEAKNNEANGSYALDIESQEENTEESMARMGCFKTIRFIAQP